MARVSEGVLPSGYQEGITLDRYQELMGLPIAAFNGLNNPNEANDYKCSTIWSQTERNYVAKFLASAEEMREQELGFFIAPKYISNEKHSPYSPCTLSRKHLISVGKLTDTLIAAGATVVLSPLTDPIEIVVATSVTDTSEILVTYPGETVQIHPSRVTISSGNAHIFIPRSRLVDPLLNDDRDDPLDYFDDDNFIDSIDVYRRWYDPYYGVDIVSHLVNSFSQNVSHGYAEISDYRTSVVDVHSAEWVAGVPQPKCITSLAFCGEIITHFNFNYLSGRQLSVKVELETARLAHTLMPHSPCECEAVNMYWLSDCDTKEYDMTPYGNMHGCIQAWISDTRAKVGFGTTVGGFRR